MSDITEFTKDMNIIGSLPDQPTLTTDALKQKFDEGGIAIKEYLNDTLITDLNTFKEEVSEDVSTAVESIDTKINTNLYGEGGTYDTPTSDSPVGKIKTEVSDTKTTLESEMSTLDTTLTNKVNTAIAGVIKYSSFAVTRTSVKTKNNGIVYTSTKDADECQYVTKSGYYPIALVGVQSADYRSSYSYRFGYLSEQGSGTCLAHWFFANEESWSINEQDLPNCIVSILWVKI